jgi:hypothetical protein
MWETFLAAGSKIIDLLHRRDESAKTRAETALARVETQLAEHDLRTSTRLIYPASFEDVERFDPKTRELNRVVSKAEPPAPHGLPRALVRRPPALLLLICFVGLATIIVAASRMLIALIRMLISVLP